jgi:hypothetical protein
MRHIINLLFNFVHKKTDIITANNITTPPIVGVPFLIKCVEGPSILIVCITLNLFNFFIIYGHTTKQTKKLINAAPIALKIGCCKILNKYDEEVLLK